MPRSDKQLDREIAESYLGRPITGYTVSSPFDPGRSRRVTGVAREIEERRGGLLLWIELPDGRRLPVAYEWIEPVVPRATARLR